MLHPNVDTLRYFNTSEPVSNIKCIAEIPVSGDFYFYHKDRVAQWLAHAIVCHVVAGSIPGDNKQFFLCPVALPETYVRL